MEDRYLNLSESINRLVADYKKHGNLYIGFDFDNTVFDFHKVGDTFPRLERVLKFLKKNGFKLILFTGHDERKELIRIIKYCSERGYEPDYINESPVMKTKKPYYNILLDDRAGLGSAYHTLIITLKHLNYDYTD